ncbi:hypothetical protein ALC57_05838 [Trachymyrmex cornetzi]|uniref:Transposable element P transposase n=1 Tax=Trachymyrmex cornetzi TaxID=471704 RepID=A0A151J9N9_9HYME|nr:hypothetical protein ALC57_05838 [Trachymyrmex cornetzi]
MLSTFVAFNLFANKLNSRQLTFFQLQLRLSGTIPNGRRFTKEEKALALSFYKTSGQCYYLLRSMFFLPSVRTLRNMLSHLKLDTGLNRTILTALKSCVNEMKNEKDKLVILMWDEMKTSAHLQYDPNVDKVVGFEDWVSINSGHKEFCVEQRKFIQNMRFVHKITMRPVHRVPCITNWLITLQGFILLYKRLILKEGFKSFSPRYINQDNLENYFGRIRSQGCRNIVPSSWQFIGAYKSLLIYNFTSPHSLSANCENDEGDMLLNLAYMLDKHGNNLDSDILDKDNINIENNYNDNTDINQIIYDVENSTKSLSTDSTSYSQSNLASVAFVIRKMLRIMKDCIEYKSNIFSNRDINGNIVQCLNPKILQSFTRSVQIIQNLLQSFAFVKNIVTKLTEVLIEEEIMEWIQCSHHAPLIRQCFAKHIISCEINAFCTKVNRILSGK